MSIVRRLSTLLKILTLSPSNSVRPVRCFCALTSDARKLQENVAHRGISNAPPATLRSDSSSLTTEISTCTTHSHIFQLVNDNHERMGGREAIRALQSLFALVKTEHEFQKTITSTQEFGILCEILKKKIRQLSNYDVISALRVLNDFGVPTETVIVQMLLQIIRNSINNLSTEQIIFLNYFLPKLGRTPLVIALSAALPRVLKSHIKSQLDFDNIDTLVKTLCQFTGEPVYDHDSVSIVLRHLNIVPKALIKPNHARVIMAKIACLDHDETSIAVIRKCQEIIMDSIDDIEPNTLAAVVHTTSYDCRKRSGIMYNGRLLDACAMAIISRDLDLAIAVDTLRDFIHIGHISKSLLDYVAQRCFEEVEANRSIDIQMARILVGGMTTANYKPIFWNKMETQWMEKLLEIPFPTILGTAINLASIDCYWPKLLETIFTRRHYYGAYATRTRFFLLYNAVKTIYPKYDGPWPSSEMLKHCEPNVKISSGYTRFKLILERTLGGSQYLLTNVKTAMGYTIDHVAIMNDDGIPIELNNTNESVPLVIEEINRPDHSNMLLFLYIPESGCIHNIRHHGGFWSLLIQTLETAINCKVIPMFHEMHSLPNTEIATYISKSINENINTYVIRNPHNDSNVS